MNTDNQTQVARPRSSDRLAGHAARFRTLPWWGRILVVYGASRVLSTALLATIYLLALANGWSLPSSRPDPTFFTFLSSWDSTYYRRIAEGGYPLQIPTDSDGNVVPNSWAFLPVYPFLVRGLMMLTSLPFDGLAVVVSALCGAGAALLLYRVVRTRTTERAAVFATVLFCFGPLSFLLQVAYAESLVLVLTFAALLALLKRRYLLVIPFAVVAAFTRPGILALALALGIHLVVRWITERGGFPWRDRIRIVVAGIVISAAGLSWPVIASAVTGRPEAYLDTELSWWVGYVGRQHFTPLTPWFTMAGTYLGVAGIVLVVAVLIAFGWWLASRPLRALGPDLLAYGASYGLYLFAVFLPQQSLFRLVMPLAPLLGDARLSATAPRRRILLAISIALQPVAIVLLWFVGYP